MEHKTNSQILHEAADWIDRQGWAQGGGWPDTVPPKQGETLCLEGGIAAALHMNFVFVRDHWDTLANHPAYRAVAAYLGHEQLGARVDGTLLPLYSWNDRYNTTKEDVIAVLRAVAELEHYKESGGAEAAAVVAEALPF